MKKSTLLVSLGAVALIATSACGSNKAAEKTEGGADAAKAGEGSCGEGSCGGEKKEGDAAAPAPAEPAPETAAPAPGN